MYFITRHAFHIIIAALFFSRHMQFECAAIYAAPLLTDAHDAADGVIVAGTSPHTRRCR